MGATVIKTLDEKYYSTIRDWLENGKSIEVNYPDITAEIVAKIIKNHVPFYKQINREKISAGV